MLFPKDRKTGDFSDGSRCYHILMHINKIKENILFGGNTALPKDMKIK